MKIGILSDTHGDVERTRSAVQTLLSQSVTQLIHCGDIGSERVLFELVEHCTPAAIPVHAVLGNVDLYDDAVRNFPPESGVEVKRKHELKLGGSSILVIHGDDYVALEDAIDSGAFDLIFTGHTHVAADRRVGNSRIINPGAVTHAETPGFATLDLSSGLLEPFRFI